MEHHQRSISLKRGLQTEENMDGVHVFFILKVWTPGFNMDGVHVIFVLKDGRPGLTNLTLLVPGSYEFYNSHPKSPSKVRFFKKNTGSTIIYIIICLYLIRIY